MQLSSIICVAWSTLSLCVLHLPIKTHSCPKLLHRMTQSFITINIRSMKDKKYKLIN